MSNDFEWSGSDEDEEPESADTVERGDSGKSGLVQNHVYFYSRIDDSSALKFNRMIRSVDRDNQQLAIERGDTELDPIVVHVNSIGGIVSSGVSMLDTLKSVKSPVHTIVEGSAASSATLITVAGDKRFITPNSYMLIHQITGGYRAKYETFSDQSENMKRMMDMLKRIYNKNCDISPEKLDESIMNECYFWPDDCLEYGMVDEVKQ